jgi:UDP-N-acetylglucosamine pyrophosphorylase
MLQPGTPFLKTGTLSEYEKRYRLTVLSFISQLYIENILALETKAKCSKTGTGKPLPLVIMTSDDTHSHTQQLLEEHAYYGADPSQIRLLKQEKVWK